MLAVQCRKGVVRIDISYLIDRLENLLNNSRRLPLTSGTIVDRDECLEIIDQMRITIPQQIEEARRIEQERDKVVALAHEEANRIIDQAHDEAERLLEERGLLEEAEKRSATIIDEALRQAQETMRGADQYAVGVLGQLEDQLIAVQTTIRNGLDLLQRDGRTSRLPMESDEVDSATEPGSENSSGP